MALRTWWFQNLKQSHRISLENTRKDGKWLSFILQVVPVGHESVHREGGLDVHTRILESEVGTVS